MVNYSELGVENLGIIKFSTLDLTTKVNPDQSRIANSFSSELFLRKKKESLNTISNGIEPLFLNSDQKSFPRQTMENQIYHEWGGP